MDFNEQVNGGAENTPEMETEKLDAVQDTVEAPADSAPKAAPANAALAGFVGKAKAKANELAKDERVAKGVEMVKKVPKKTWLTIAIAVAVLIVGIFTLSIVTNTYKTPMKLYVKYMNAETHKNPLNDQIKLLNGFCTDEMKAVIKILKKSDDYKEALEEMQESWEERVESYKEQYGDDYKYSFKIEDKEKLDKDDCKDYQDDLRDTAKSMLSSLDDEYEDFESDDWSDFADDMGISRSDAKKYVKALEALCKEMKQAKVTAGYELDIIIKITGSELDEPKEQERTIHVYKINGRWVSPELSFMGLTGILP